MPTQSELGLYPLPTYSEGPDAIVALADLVEKMEQHDVLWAISVNDRNQRYNACVDGTVVAVSTTTLAGLYMKVPTAIDASGWATIWVNNSLANKFQGDVVYASSEAERNTKYGTSQLGTLCAITPGPGIVGLVSLSMKTGTSSNAWRVMVDNTPVAAPVWTDIPKTWAQPDATISSGKYRIIDGCCEFYAIFNYNGDDINVSGSGNFADKNFLQLPASLYPVFFESQMAAFGAVSCQMQINTAGRLTLCSGLPGVTYSDNGTVRVGTWRYPLATP